MKWMVLVVCVACGGGDSTPSCDNTEGECICHVGETGLGGDGIPIAQCSTAAYGGSLCCAESGWSSNTPDTECACFALNQAGCSGDTTECDCNLTGGFGDTPVSECPKTQGTICCLGNSGTPNATTCGCSTGITACASDETQVDSCSPSSITCVTGTTKVSTCASDAGSNSDCWYPNWESDCGSDADCDPGLMCTDIGGNMRCHGVACSTDQDCENTYGTLEKDGRTYCASTCGTDGLCHF